MSTWNWISNERNKREEEIEEKNQAQILKNHHHHAINYNISSFFLYKFLNVCGLEMLMKKCNSLCEKQITSSHTIPKHLSMTFSNRWMRNTFFYLEHWFRSIYLLKHVSTFYLHCVFSFDVIFYFVTIAHDIN